MAKIPSKIVTVVIIISCVAVVLGIRAYLDARGHLTQALPARAKGNPKASMKITEFIDFQCPACARGSIFLSKYIEKYPDRIYLEVKYFPLGTAHRHAYRSALYAECAARQGRFWPFHDELLQRQSEWEGLVDAEAFFTAAAQKVPLDMQKLDSCLKDEKVMDFIFDEKDEGSSLRIRSTPTYVIDGKIIVGTDSLGEVLKKRFGDEE